MTAERRVRDGFGIDETPEIDFHIRCRECNKYLMRYAARPWLVQCRGCKAIVRAGDLPAGVAVPDDPTVPPSRRDGG